MCIRDRVVIFMVEIGGMFFLINTRSFDTDNTLIAKKPDPLRCKQLDYYHLYIGVCVPLWERLSRRKVHESIWSTQTHAAA